MNLTSCLLVFLLWLPLGGIVQAVKVDFPGQAEKESPIIVTAKILEIYSRITRDDSYEWHRCVAAIRIESIQKCLHATLISDMCQLSARQSAEVGLSWLKLST